MKWFIKPRGSKGLMKWVIKHWAYSGGRPRLTFSVVEAEDVAEAKREVKRIWGVPREHIVSVRVQKTRGAGRQEKPTRRRGKPSIARIDKAEKRLYTDSGQTKVYVWWTDTVGESGRTEGDEENAHMKALLDRARREGVTIEETAW